MKQALLFVAALLCCTAAGQASPAPAPPIDAAALEAYHYGTGVISGKAGAYRGGYVSCAPDVAYVEWYVSSKTPALDYDSRLVPFTHVVWLNDDGTFACTGLGPGRYIIWAESGRRVNGPSPPTTVYTNQGTNAAGRPPTVDNNSGELLPAGQISSAPTPWWEQQRTRATSHIEIVRSAAAHIVLTDGEAKVDF
jgi:hypothetical protein